MDARDIEDIFPLSPVQQGMLFHMLSQPGRGLYFEQMTCTLTGPLDVPAFESAWQRVAERHGAFRTGFVWEGLERPLQVVHRRAPVEITVTDLRGEDPEDRERRLADLLISDRRRGFSLGRPPLTRLRLVRLGEGRHRLIWSSSHLVNDAWCVSIVLREVVLFYHSALHGAEVSLPPAPSYKEFVLWLGRHEPATAERYWKKTLAGFRTATPLGEERRGEVTEGADAGRHRHRIEMSSEASEALRALARRRGITLHGLFLGIWGLMLGEISGQRDVVFGTVFSGRPPEVPGIESMVGLFINTLPMRLDLTFRGSFLEWAAGIQDLQLEVHEVETCPLSRVLGWSEVPRSRPLFESILVFFNVVDESLLTAGEFTVSEVQDVSHSNFPLVVRIWPRVERTDRFGLEMLYEPRRFAVEAIDRHLAGLRRIAEGVARNPDAGLDELRSASRATDGSGSPRHRAHRDRIGRRLRQLSPSSVRIGAPERALDGPAEEKGG